MVRLPVALVALAVLVAVGTVVAQSSAAQTPANAAASPQVPTQASSEVPAAFPGNASAAPEAPPIPAGAPRMSKQTRYQIIRDFETQMVYSRASFPMGSRGLKLKDGVTTPNGQDLQAVLALWGPSIKPGDPAHISYIRIKDNFIHFDLNGGPERRNKWYNHIQISGTGGAPVPIGNDQSVTNPHGSYLDIYFDKYVPEMSPAQLRQILYPVLDFNAKNKEEAYLDTVPPKAKEAIKAHHVLVGMNTEMVLHAMGKPPRKVREKDGDIPYEEWIYGTPPEDVNFVRIVDDEVVRVETMKVGGEKIVRTEKEVILPKPEKEEQAKTEPGERPADAPTMRRPGDTDEDVPRPSDGSSPMPAPLPQPLPPTVPQGPGQGPGEFAGGLR